MERNHYTLFDIEKEIDEKDEAIFTHLKIIEKLKEQRNELLAQRSDWRMQEVFELAVEYGLTPDEMKEIVFYALKRKRTEEQAAS